MTSGRCDSCGAADSDDLLAVHRAYVTPAAWDTEEKVEVLDEVERWCVPCRTHYPHQEVAGRLGHPDRAATGHRERSSEAG